MRSTFYLQFTGCVYVLPFGFYVSRSRDTARYRFAHRGYSTRVWFTAVLLHGCWFTGLPRLRSLLRLRLRLLRAVYGSPQVRLHCVLHTCHTTLPTTRLYYHTLHYALPHAVAGCGYVLPACVRYTHGSFLPVMPFRFTFTAYLLPVTTICPAVTHARVTRLRFCYRSACRWLYYYVLFCNSGYLWFTGYRLRSGLPVCLIPVVPLRCAHLVGLVTCNTARLPRSYLPAVYTLLLVGLRVLRYRTAPGYVPYLLLHTLRCRYTPTVLRCVRGCFVRYAFCGCVTRRLVFTHAVTTATVVPTYLPGYRSTVTPTAFGSRCAVLPFAVWLRVYAVTRYWIAIHFHTTLHWLHLLLPHHTTPFGFRWFLRSVTRFTTHTHYVYLRTFAVTTLRVTTRWLRYTVGCCSLCRCHTFAVVAVLVGFYGLDSCHRLPGSCPPRSHVLPLHLPFTVLLGYYAVAILRSPYLLFVAGWLRLRIFPSYMRSRVRSFYRLQLRLHVLRLLRFLPRITFVVPVYVTAGYNVHAVCGSHTLRVTQVVPRIYRAPTRGFRLCLTIYTVMHYLQFCHHTTWLRLRFTARCYWLPHYAPLLRAVHVHYCRSCRYFAGSATVCRTHMQDTTVRRGYTFIHCRCLPLPRTAFAVPAAHRTVTVTVTLPTRSAVTGWLRFTYTPFAVILRCVYTPLRVVLDTYVLPHYRCAVTIVCTFLVTFTLFACGLVLRFCRCLPGLRLLPHVRLVCHLRFTVWLRTAAVAYRLPRRTDTLPLDCARLRRVYRCAHIAVVHALHVHLVTTRLVPHQFASYTVLPIIRLRYARSLRFSHTFVRRRLRFAFTRYARTPRCTRLHVTFVHTVLPPVGCRAHRLHRLVDATLPVYAYWLRSTFLRYRLRLLFTFTTTRGSCGSFVHTPPRYLHRVLTRSPLPLRGSAALRMRFVPFTHTYYVRSCTVVALPHAGYGYVRLQVTHTPFALFIVRLRFCSPPCRAAVTVGCLCPTHHLTRFY